MNKKNDDGLKMKLSILNRKTEQVSKQLK